MSEFIYGEYLGTSLFEAEKQGFANLIKSIIYLRGLSTLWNCQTNNNDPISTLTDDDLVSSKYPILYNLPSNSRLVTKDVNMLTTKCFNFLEMVNGNYCTILPKDKTFIVDSGTIDDDGNIIYNKVIFDMHFIFDNTGYISISSNRPELVAKDLSIYED